MWPRKDFKGQGHCSMVKGQIKVIQDVVQCTAWWFSGGVTIVKVAYEVVYNALMILKKMQSVVQQ